MPWVRLDDAFYDHPCMAGLSLEAWGLWAWSLAWSNRNLTDGKIPAAVARRMDPDGKASGALTQSGRWDMDGETVIVHDYLDYQHSAEQIRTKRERERLRWQRRGTRADAPGDPDADSPAEPEPPPDQQRAHSAATPRASQPQPQDLPPGKSMAPARRREPDLLWDAIVECWQIDQAELTTAERGRLNKAAAQLRAVNANPDEIPIRRANYRLRFPDAADTPMAVVNRWAESKTRPGPSRDPRSSSLGAAIAEAGR